MTTYNEKIEMIKNNVNLEILAKDEDWKVRRAVAKKGECLDLLIDDDTILVRLEVARHGYGLETLVNDEDSVIRLEVAKHGKFLVFLVNDESEEVRDVAMKLLGHKAYKIAPDVAGGNLYLYIKDSEYIVLWGWRAKLSNSLEKFHDLVEEDLDEETLEEYKNIMEDLIKYSKLDKKYLV